MRPQSEPSTILVVDDDPLILMDLADQVRQLGYVALEAHSGAEALKALRSGPAPDALITDQAMPGMTGAELAHAVREQLPGLPVLICSGYGDMPEEAPQGCRQIGKPIDPLVLETRLREMVAAD